MKVVCWACVVVVVVVMLCLCSVKDVVEGPEIEDEVLRGEKERRKG